MGLGRKIDSAIKLLKSIRSDEIELCYSGGKDSDVILKLAKMADIPFRAIYKKTTIDPPGTIAHCRMNGVEIHEPKLRFFDLIKQRGFPTMRCRFCCNELKEYKILDNSIQGIRRCESEARKKRYKEPVICRMYGNNKNNKVNVYLPILYWSDQDIVDFVKMQKIQLHGSYYVNGVFDVSKRLGCLGCPLASDRGLSDFKDHPRLVRLWIDAAKIWWDKPRKKNIRSKEKFNDVYELFVHNIFFKTYEDFFLARNGLFGRIDCRNFLEKYFNIEL